MILVVHYLQTVPSPPILPLLDPQTLLAVNAPLMPNKQSLAELLLGFFSHYAVLPMDQALCIATACFLPRPDAWRPGAEERFCILDPLSPGVDLGRHLTTSRSYRLRREFARARSELMSGTKLEDMINDRAFWRRKRRQLAADSQVQARMQAMPQPADPQSTELGVWWNKKKGWRGQVWDVTEQGPDGKNAKLLHTAYFADEAACIAAHRALKAEMKAKKALVLYELAQALPHTRGLPLRPPTAAEAQPNKAYFGANKGRPRVQSSEFIVQESRSTARRGSCA